MIPSPELRVVSSDALVRPEHAHRRWVSWNSAPARRRRSTVRRTPGYRPGVRSGPATPASRWPFITMTSCCGHSSGSRVRASGTACCITVTQPPLVAHSAPCAARAVVGDERAGPLREVQLRSPKPRREPRREAVRELRAPAVVAALDHRVAVGVQQPRKRRRRRRDRELREVGEVRFVGVHVEGASS